ncbi:MAG: GNAT family N-acetyltransferase [Chloroflexi bacterium]|nr:GNAT family N-acetyltransferase [Chloroflexota bacterium]MCI0580825.1 GNAT family N-acetyltransferase [Chloroflexota bacterium]MCI0648181.1 GNAT family N-acetyltransferase [Chloroflexota bacterium]MCI0730323.1 GNAT family N-acetyltransferase [Chloroflexota bacterium]
MNVESITIRPADPKTDFADLARLISRVWPDRAITEDTLHEWERDNPPGRIRRRTVAITPEGQIAGYGIVNHAPWTEEGRFFLWVAAVPEWQKQGLGGRLYDDSLHFALAHGANLLDSEVRDDDDASLRFAQKRGFAVHRHIFESVIDLRTFDESPFAGLIEEVEAGGIRFFSLADAGNSEEVLRQLYAVNLRAVQDDPGLDGDSSFPPFEEFRKVLYGSSWFLPEGQLLAADGDEVIGLAAVGYHASNNSMANMITGVDRAYRGRKIAQALKLLAIRFAQAYGVDTIRTDNDSQNEPMLAINRKLGYRPQPGFYRLVGELSK